MLRFVLPVVLLLIPSIVADEHPSLRMGSNDDEGDNMVRELVALNGMNCKYVVPNGAPSTAEKSELQCAFRINPDKKRNFGQWCAKKAHLSKTTGEKIEPICVTVQSTVNPKMGEKPPVVVTKPPQPPQQPKPPVNVDPNSFPQPLPGVENYGCPKVAPRSGSDCQGLNRRCIYNL